MSLSVSDRDNGYSRLLTSLRKIRKTTVAIGVNEEPHEGSNGLTNADVGAFHEFGLGNNPERSFLRGWVDEHKREWFGWLRSGVLAAVLKGRGWADQYGQYCVEGVRKRIRDHIPPPLEQATIDRKGGESTPLIDTEQLIDGIEYEVWVDR